MKSNRRNFFIQSSLLGTSAIGLTTFSADHIHKNQVVLKNKSSFDPSKDPKRIRKSFYDLTDEELRNLCKAVGYMRNDIPTDSPLHWENYGRQHAHHCTEAGDNNPQVHWSWHFLPWHRGYVYFMERILANILTTKLNIDGSKFSYPYWDWCTHQEIPNTRLRQQAGLASPLFGYDLTQEDMVNADNLGFDNTALYDGSRGPTILKPKMDPDNELTEDSKNHIKDALYYTSATYINKILTAPFEQFAGGSTIDRTTGQGLLEQNPHNDGHDWVGTRIGKNRTMGTLRYAALDPIFYMHHGNIDRIFSLYNQPMPSLDGPWGQQTYEYTDIDGTWVKVSVKDIMTGISNNISYGESPLMAKIKPNSSKVTRNIVVSVNKQIENEPVTVTLNSKIIRKIITSKLALMDVKLGSINYTGKYKIDIKMTDANGVQNNVGRIRMLDGEHRKDVHPKSEHVFSVALKTITAPPTGDVVITFVPPKKNVKINIKTLEFMSVE
jgi:hypothetical protein